MPRKESVRKKNPVRCSSIAKSSCIVPPVKCAPKNFKKGKPPKASVKDAGVLELQQCIICLGTKKSTQKETVSCGHTFHRQCIKRWLKNANSCPICRKTVEGLSIRLESSPRHNLRPELNREQSSLPQEMQQRQLSLEMPHVQQRITTSQTGPLLQTLRIRTLQIHPSPQHLQRRRTREHSAPSELQQWPFRQLEEHQLFQPLPSTRRPRQEITSEQKQLFLLRQQLDQTGHTIRIQGEEQVQEQQTSNVQQPSERSVPTQMQLSGEPSEENLLENLLQPLDRTVPIQMPQEQLLQNRPSEEQLLEQVRQPLKQPDHSHCHGNSGSHRLHRQLSPEEQLQLHRQVVEDVLQASNEQNEEQKKFRKEQRELLEQQLTLSVEQQKLQLEKCKLQLEKYKLKEEQKNFQKEQQNLHVKQQKLEKDQSKFQKEQHNLHVEQQMLREEQRKIQKDHQKLSLEQCNLQLQKYKHNEEQSKFEKEQNKFQKAQQKFQEEQSNIQKEQWKLREEQRKLQEEQRKVQREQRKLQEERKTQGLRHQKEQKLV